MSGTWFDSEEDKKHGFQIVPPGTYKMVLNHYEVRQTKARESGGAMRGEMLSVELEVLDDRFNGAKIFERFNIAHDKEKVQNIGRGQFARMCEALCVDMKIREPEAFEFEIRKSQLETQLRAIRDKIVWAEVGVKFNDYTGKDENVIKKWLKPRQPEQQPAQQFQPGQAQQQQPQSQMQTATPGTVRDVRSFQTPQQQQPPAQNQQPVDPNDPNIPF